MTPYTTTTDMLGRKVSVPDRPQRIVSLVPSQTELLAYLGLEEEVVGITKFCVHPTRWFRTKKRVGGTKQVHLQTIRNLKPDLLIANKEENTKAHILELAKQIPVWVSDVVTWQDAENMIRAIGKLVKKSEPADKLLQTLAQQVQTWAPPVAPVSVAYVIWKDPLMVAGAQTFINEVLTMGGFDNVFSDKARYPQVTWSDLQQKAPDVVLLSSEPFPFQQKHIAAFQNQLPTTKIVLADGELFSWYGSRLLKTIPYLQQLHTVIYRI